MAFFLQCIIHTCRLIWDQAQLWEEQSKWIELVFPFSSWFTHLCNLYAQAWFVTHKLLMSHLYWLDNWTSPQTYIGWTIKIAIQNQKNLDWQEVLSRISLKDWMSQSTVDLITRHILTFDKTKMIRTIDIWRSKKTKNSNITVSSQITLQMHHLAHKQLTETAWIKNYCIYGMFIWINSHKSFADFQTF